MRWLDLFTWFDITICHIPGKSNVITDALLHHPYLAVVIGSVKSGLLTQIREAYIAASGDSWEQLKKLGCACEPGFMFCDGLLCCTHGSNEVSLVIPEDAGLRTDFLQ